MAKQTFLRLGVIVAAALALAGGVRADDAFNIPVVFDEAAILARQPAPDIVHDRQWRATLQPESGAGGLLREARERASEKNAFTNTLHSRPPMAALDHGPTGVQVCALYAQQRARLFRHYRALLDLTDLGDRRIIRQLADWLYKNAKSEGVDFVIVWCDDILADSDGGIQSRIIIGRAVTLVIEMLDEDGGDVLMLDELREYLRRI